MDINCSYNRQGCNGTSGTVDELRCNVISCIVMQKFKEKIGEDLCVDGFKLKRTWKETTEVTYQMSKLILITICKQINNFLFTQ